MVSISAKLIFLISYQNQGTLVDYLDPWIAKWAPEFTISDSLHQRILEAGFDEDEIEDVIKESPNIKPGPFGFETDLLLEWTNWIMNDPERKEIIKKELHDYFFWHGEFEWDNSEVPWITEEGMPNTPQEALEWFKGEFGE